MLRHPVDRHGMKPEVYRDFPDRQDGRVRWLHLVRLRMMVLILVASSMPEFTVVHFPTHQSTHIPISRRICTNERNFRKELLRLRDVFAEIYLSGAEKSEDLVYQIYKVLLLFKTNTSKLVL